MKTLKMYEASDKMVTLMRDNYHLLQTLESFGIHLGFRDKTVKEMCEENNVDTYTFLAVVNYTINGHTDFNDDAQLDVRTLLHYLEASHTYFLDYQLPTIRKKLGDCLDSDNALGQLIMKFFDDYAREIQRHMQYEEKTLFPYVEALLNGEAKKNYNVDTFSKHHESTDRVLIELKLMVIKYLPSDGKTNNKLMAADAHSMSTNRHTTNFSIKALRPCSLDSPSNLSKMALACSDTASHTSQIPSKTSI